MKYDGEASHPSHHSSGYHGHGRQGKTLRFDDQPSVQTNSQSSFRSEDSGLFGSNNVREGKSFGFDELPSYSGRQGKSQEIEENLGNTATQSDSFFSSIDRSGKSLGFESRAVDNSSPNPIPVASHFKTVHHKSENHDAGDFGSFKRQGKSLEETSFGFPSSSGHLSADHGSFGSFLSSARNGKSLDLESSNLKETKTKKKKSNLISRRRIERAGILETSASEKVNTSASEKGKPYASEKVKPYASEKVKNIKPQTFFEYAPKNVKSPFPSNFHEELKLRNEQNDKKHRANEQILKGLFGIQKTNQKIANIQKIQQETEGIIKTQKQIDDLKNIQQEVEEIQSGNVNHQINTKIEENGSNQTSEKYHKEVEVEKGSLPVIRGKIIYGP